MLASYNNQLEVVKELLKTNADISTRMNDGWTALLLASEQGHVEIVQELLRNNADINEKNDVFFSF